MTKEEQKGRILQLLSESPPCRWNVGIYTFSVYSCTMSEPDGLRSEEEYTLFL